MSIGGVAKSLVLPIQMQIANLDVRLFESSLEGDSALLAFPILSFQLPEPHPPKVGAVRGIWLHGVQAASGQLVLGTFVQASARACNSRRNFGWRCTAPTD